MSFSQNVKALREEKGWSQSELAKKLGVSQALVAQYELGSRVPAIFVAVKLAETLGTTCETLVSDRPTQNK